MRATRWLARLSLNRARVFVLSAVSDASCAISPLFLNHKTRNEISLPLFYGAFHFFSSPSPPFASKAKHRPSSYRATGTRRERELPLTSFGFDTFFGFKNHSLPSGWSEHKCCRCCSSKKEKTQTKIYEKLWSDFFFLSFSCNKLWESIVY